MTSQTLWRDLISDGGLSVNTPGAPVNVTGDKAAVVVPLSISAARDYLKREDKLRLPSNHRLYLERLPDTEISQPLKLWLDVNPLVSTFRYG